MPTPIYVGLTDTYSETSLEEIVNREGLDNLIVRLRGKSSVLETNFARWSRGDGYAGYSAMTLDTKRRSQSGPIGEIELTFSGFIETATSENGLVDINDEITEQTVTLTTDADENVQFQYHAQQTTSRWIHRGPTRPSAPKFKTVVNSEINTLTLFNPSPPNYTGSIANQSKKVGRLIQFSRQRLSPNMWAVVETWQNRIEPNIEIS